MESFIEECDTAEAGTSSAIITAEGRKSVDDLAIRTEFNSSDSEPCLICSDPIMAGSRWQLHSTHFFPGCDENKTLNDQLLSMFVLRKLLNFSKENCAQLLKQTFGVTNPGNWFDLCSTCAELVKCALEIHQKILELKSVLNNYGLGMRRVLKCSIESETSDKENILDPLCGNLINPREIIRNHFKDSKTSTAVSFVAKQEKEEMTEDNLSFVYDDNFLDEDSQYLEWSREVEEEQLLNDPLYIPDSDKNLLKTKASPKSGFIKLKNRKQKQQLRRYSSLGKNLLFEIDETKVALDNQEMKEAIKQTSVRRRKSVHRKGVIIKCKICHRVYTNTCYYSRHMTLHKKCKDTTCKKCNYPCTSKLALERHMKMGCEQTYRKGVLFECNICGFTSSIKYVFRHHLNTHTKGDKVKKDDEENKPSPITNKAETDNYSLHELGDSMANSLSVDEVELGRPADSIDSVEHKKEGHYQAGSKQASLKRRAALLIHKSKSRQKGKTNIFKCKVCPYSAKTQLKLRIHSMKFHQKDFKLEKDFEIQGDPSNVTDHDDDDDDEKPSTSDQLEKMETNVSNSPPDEKHEDTHSTAEGKKSKPKSGRIDGNLLCKLCTRSFYSATYLKRHMVEHEINKDFCCPKCNYPCSGPLRLQFHIKNELCNWRKKYPCNECDFVAKSMKILNTHVANHKVEKSKYFCKICGRKYTNEEFFERHMSNHEKFKEFTCTKCNFPCKDSGTLNTHMSKNLCYSYNSLLRKAPYQCESCSYTTTNRILLQRHYRSHKIFDGTKEADGQFKCNLCQEVFPNKRRLFFHKQEKHKDEVGLEIHQCPSCPKKYARLATLKDHQKQVHANDCRYYCEICGYGTNHQYVLNEHSLKHKDELPFVCESCGTSYKYLRGLKQHIKDHHSGGNAKKSKRDFKCKYCTQDVVYPSKALFNIHLKNSHNDMFIHQCDECENTYMSVASLQLHKKISHSNEKVKCQFCDKVYSSRFNLYSHSQFCKKLPPGFKFSVPRGGKSKT